MSDLVERLREALFDPYGKEAADELNRLYAEKAELVEALERTRDNFIRLLEQKPVRDAGETIAEADRALARAENKETG